MKVFDTVAYKDLHHAFDCMDDMIDSSMKNFTNQKDEEFIFEFVGYLRRSLGIRNRVMNGQNVQA